MSDPKPNDVVNVTPVTTAVRHKGKLYAIGTSFEAAYKHVAHLIVAGIATFAAEVEKLPVKKDELLAWLADKGDKNATADMKMPELVARAQAIQAGTDPDGDAPDGGDGGNDK